MNSKNDLLTDIAEWFADLQRPETDDFQNLGPQVSGDNLFEQLVRLISDRNTAISRNSYAQVLKANLKPFQIAHFFLPSETKLRSFVEFVPPANDPSRNEITDYILAATYYECSGGQVPEEEAAHLFIYSDYEEKFGRYLKARTRISDSRRYLRENLRRHVNNISVAAMAETEIKFKALQSSFEDYFQKLQESTGQSINADINRITEQSKEQLDNYIAGVGATLVVKDAHTLWRDKSNMHRWFFAFFGVLFIAGVAAAIAAPIYYWPQIFSEIEKLDQLFEKHIIGGVILILIPVLGVAWVLRLISRFTIQNMVLADDAQLRRVMAETYVKLVSEGAIKEPEDRAIILTALFRPLPGSHSDDVSPPSITDILKQGGKS